METQTINSEVLEILKKLQTDVNYIKSNIQDSDTILDEDDMQAIEAYEKEKKNGELISHEQLKKELNL